MKILAVGGGSGGHVTPVVAVLRELRLTQPDAEIRFWSDKKFGAQAKSLMANFDDTIAVSQITSGKLRRYNNLSMWRQLARPFSIVLPNLRDLFFVGVGTIESVIKLLAWRPDVIFTKGGYVCLPVGIAAHLLKIPLVEHDSDAHPGLTNRILSRWASAIATGAPLEYYSYPAAITKYVGIPVAPEFAPVTKEEQMAAKQAYHFDPLKPLVVITGGGLGAERINTAVAETLNELLRVANIALISGVAQYEELKASTPQDDPRYQLMSFVSKDMAKLLSAADIVVTRAGATTLLELAAMAKPIILVPNGYLTGGHQLKNAKVYADKEAAYVINDIALEDHPENLLRAIEVLLLDPKKAKAMADSLASFAKPNAARDVADMILSAVK